MPIHRLLRVITPQAHRQPANDQIDPARLAAFRAEMGEERRSTRSEWTGRSPVLRSAGVAVRGRRVKDWLQARQRGGLADAQAASPHPPGGQESLARRLAKPGPGPMRLPDVARSRPPGVRSRAHAVWTSPVTPSWKQGGHNHDRRFGSTLSHRRPRRGARHRHLPSLRRFLMAAISGGDVHLAVNMSGVTSSAPPGSASSSLRLTGAGSGRWPVAAGAVPAGAAAPGRLSPGRDPADSPALRRLLPCRQRHLRLPAPADWIRKASTWACVDWEMATAPGRCARELSCVVRCWARRR